jgi:choline dehydrogenase-like flavoprotein
LFSFPLLFRLFRYFRVFRNLFFEFTMTQQKFDVCVVGSGPGGGIATYVLAQAGLKVALVEAGSQWKAGIDFGTHAWPYDVLTSRHQTGQDNTPRLKFESNHFTPVGDTPRHGQLRALGGRSLCWAGHSLRFGPLDFQQWPISYDEVAPYYSKAEKFMGVYGYQDGLSNLPDGEFQKGVPMRCPEAGLKRGVTKLKAQGRAMDFIAMRKAILTEPHASKRATCHYCGQCMLGCDVDAKYTSANTPIPLALKTGNLTLFTNAMMTRIVTEANKIKAIEYVNQKGQTEKIEAKAFVLACSAVETARHLLLNTTREFPHGLANTSGQVGKNLTSHFGFYVVGFLPDLANRDVANEDGTDYFHSLLTGLYWDKPSPKFAGTYQVQCAAGLRGGRTPLPGQEKLLPGFGASLKQKIRAFGAGHVTMNMQGTTEISPHTFVDLDPNRKDRFGLLRPRIHLHYTPSDVAMAQDCTETCQEVIGAAGGEVIIAPPKIAVSDLIIDSNHWVGTTRMGTNPKTSVVNLSGQSHDIPNLFIGDASVFAAYPEKNPTLTNITLSWRMSELMVEKFRRGNLQ